MRDPKGSEDRLLECVKANYGSTGWGVRLSERRRNGAFRGLELLEPLSRDGMTRAKKKRQKRTDTKENPHG